MSDVQVTQSHSDGQPKTETPIHELLSLLVEAQQQIAKAQERIARALERQRLPHDTIADIEERDAITALSQLREQGERVSLAAIARRLGLAKETFRRRSANWPTFQKFLDDDAVVRPAHRGN